ncbi:NADPH-dependent aldehyde reductase 1, chloroplastic isoform X2 [Cryptomeria japonica]|uniref:NADPH-dependent aldehyde reductase 1, chloroplastic isoform X2 n=1 Tax=Cryptomeria japonica TaxID=3369 RepID=UPI0025AD38A3|nr:NADPH-dependent aldehyde reductase 1, chloroplastic isoform X2 [Cryptomeria japonica]
MSSVVENPGPQIPAQVQRQHPGLEHPMQPRPQFFSTAYKPAVTIASKLDGRVALITGGDSGIGRSIACLYALEGADVAIVYKGQIEEEDKEETLQVIHKLTNGKAKVIACPADIGFDDQCKCVVDSVVRKFGRIDILVNNAAEQFYKESIVEITPEQLERTFRSNIFSQFFLTRHCLRHMKKGSCIINTTSIVAYRGEAGLLDYCSTKGAIVSFTRGLALQLVKRGIRVNGVAPGPIWTPLIPASFPADKVEKGKWGENVPMKRPGQPFEVATSYVFLASQDASYITGQVLHPNGGAIVNA